MFFLNKNKILLLGFFLASFLASFGSFSFTLSQNAYIDFSSDFVSLNSVHITNKEEKNCNGSSLITFCDLYHCNQCFFTILSLTTSFEKSKFIFYSFTLPSLFSYKYPPHTPPPIM